MANSLLFYVVTLPHAVNIAAGVAATCAIFRLGPQLVLHRMYPLHTIFSLVLCLPVWYVGYIGPQDTVPWNNRLKFLLVGLVGLTFQHLTAAAGAIPGEHPVEPRTSIRKAVYRAIIQSLRLNDSLTDLSLIGELLAEVRY